VVDIQALAAGASGLGAQWSLRGERELEANLVYIPAGEGIDEHLASVDVVVVVVSGEGTMTIEVDRLALRPGLLVFVPRGSSRSYRAGRSGLSYLTLHRGRDEGLAIGPARTGRAGR
jgi:quercetin dioxygenase-like cupin family protein